MTLKERLRQPGIIQAPGVYDALGAILVERAGFDAVYVSGAGISYTQLGRPDLGMVYPDELLDQVGRITDRVSLPVIVDGDTGFGGVLNVHRLISGLERLGASAVQLEDQVFPKKCGHLDGKEVVSTQEMVSRIAAAVDSRHSADFLIIARTDAIAVEGLPQALDRITAYAQAGADVLFVEAPTDASMMKSIVDTVAPKPAMANMIEGGKTPFLDVKALDEIGYRMVIYPNSITRRVVYAVQEMLARLRREGTTTGLADQMVQFVELNDILGRRDLETWENRWKGFHYSIGAQRRE
ncbi:MAG: isocitrate lyase/PEP mutase family protein [Sulfobacillus sp.]